MQLTDLQEPVNFINEKFQDYEQDRQEKEAGNKRTEREHQYSE